jgi:hypothetical protein
VLRAVRYQRLVARLPLIAAFVGVAVTAAGGFAAARVPGVYWSRVQVRFIAPMSVASPNAFEFLPYSMAMMAGAVRRLVDNSDPPRTVSPDVTLADEGIRHGYSVSLPHTGGQWTDSYTEPYLNVQAVGATPAEVTTTMQRLIAEIRTGLSALERRTHTDSFNLIRTQVNPPSGVPVYYKRGSPARALLGSLGLGLGVTAAAVALTRWLVRRRIQHAVHHDGASRRATWRRALLQRATNA